MATKKKGAKRLIDLEVDEVSLVDKPAIGESIYLTKSVKGDEAVGVKKKGKVTKTDDSETTSEGSLKADEKTEAGDESSKDEAKDSEKKPEGDGSSEAEGEESKDGEGEEPKEGEAEEGKDDKKEEGKKSSSAGASAHGQDSDPAEMKTKALEKRLTKIEKNLQDVESMLSQSLELHEVVTLHLNEMMSLNLGALDAVMMLMQEDDGMGSSEEGAETQMSLITDIRESIKAVQTQVSKAGAKISRGRLTVLRELADKLTSLIQSVEGETKADGKKGSKKAVLVDLTKQFEETLTKVQGEIKDATEEVSKQLAGIDERLKSVENTAGASDAIDDDDSEETSDDSDTRKSVFAGLIPTDEIKKSVRKREKFLGR